MESLRHSFWRHAVQQPSCSVVTLLLNPHDLHPLAVFAAQYQTESQQELRRSKLSATTIIGSWIDEERSFFLRLCRTDFNSARQCSLRIIEQIHDNQGDIFWLQLPTLLITW